MVHLNDSYEQRAVNRHAKMTAIFSRVIWVPSEQRKCPQKNLELNAFLLKLSHFFTCTNLEEVNGREFFDFKLSDFTIFGCFQ